MKGKRLGFNDAAGGVVWQALKTVQALQPGIWFMENVSLIAASKSSGLSQSDIDLICQKMQCELPGNRVMCIKHIGANIMGYPARRDRVALVG